MRMKRRDELPVLPTEVSVLCPSAWSEASDKDLSFFRHGPKRQNTILTPQCQVPYGATFRNNRIRRTIR